MAAQVFIVSPVLGTAEAERCQVEPRHPPHFESSFDVLALRRVVGVDSNVISSQISSEEFRTRIAAPKGNPNITDGLR